jgi:hypothetical protein
MPGRPPAAGVLPLAACPACGHLVALLVLNTHTNAKRSRHSFWTVPGGGAEPCDSSTTATAARELWEETGGAVTARAGSVAGPAALAEFLEAGLAGGSVTTATVSSGRFVCFSARVDYCEPLMLRLALSSMRAAFSEEGHTKAAAKAAAAAASASGLADNGDGTAIKATVAPVRVHEPAQSPFHETQDIAWVHAAAIVERVAAAGVPTAPPPSAATAASVSGGGAERDSALPPKEPDARPTALVAASATPSAAAPGLPAPRFPHVAMHINDRMGTLSAGTVECVGALRLADTAAAAQRDASGSSGVRLSDPCAWAHTPTHADSRASRQLHRLGLGLGVVAGIGIGSATESAAASSRQQPISTTGAPGHGLAGEDVHAAKDESSPGCTGPATADEHADASDDARFTGRKRPRQDTGGSGRGPRRRLDAYERALMQMGEDE